jgi:predicted nucleotidyltransferase
MKQLDAINKILPLIVEDSAVRAVFLKGSIARDEIDEFSDVDFYCMVKDNEIDSFLAKRIGYMEKYRALIFWQEVNFVGPQIVGVFDDGLHFDLYTVTYDSLKRTDEIKILYDPEELLSQYVSKKLTINDDDLLEYFDEISFTLLEFEAAYRRNDLAWASRLGSHIIGYLSIILRRIYDPDSAQLGLKRLNKKLDNNMNSKLISAMDLLGPSTVLQGIKRLVRIIDEVIEKLPVNVSVRINSVFFSYMVGRIAELK